MQRVYIKNKLIGNSTTIEDSEITHRLHSVLRMQPGEQCTVFDESGTEYLAEITAIDKHAVSIGFVQQIVRESEPLLHVHLYPALFKKQRFEWMLEKCTELGVAGFYPVTAEHSVVHEHEGSTAHERWEKIIISASEQSERTSIPNVHNTQSLSDALQSATGKLLVAAERSDATAVWPDLAIGDGVSLFIGPEGGWSAEELALFKTAGATFLSFGKRILRAETACIAGSAVLLTNK